MKADINPNIVARYREAYLVMASLGYRPAALGDLRRFGLNFASFRFSRFMRFAARADLRSASASHSAFHISGGTKPTLVIRLRLPLRLRTGRTMKRSPSSRCRLAKPAVFSQCISYRCFCAHKITSLAC
jgi:hypothetical protein